MNTRFLMTPVVAVLTAAEKPPDSASKQDLDGLQGTWKLVSAMQDGKALAEDKVMKTTIVFKDDTFRFPGSVEYGEKGVMLGIYELHGDHSKVCFAPAGKLRPNELTSKLGSGYILEVWERQK